MRDPTDLIALVSLVPAWLLWKQKLHQPGIPTKRLSWTAVLCAAILTLANSALPDYGITCLSTQDGQLQAASSYQHYTSTDGGMTWQDTESQTIEGCSGYSFSTDEKAVTDPANPNRMIRYIPGVVVAYTQDGGLTWTSEYEVRPAHEADRFFYERTRSWNPRYAKPPFMAVFDQYNGNVVLAMGHEGVLVRQKSGAYLQVPVGIHHKPSRTNPGFLWKMLNGEIILALGFAGWVTAWSGRKARPSKIRTILLWLSVIAGCGLLVFVPPALQTLYLMTFAWMGTIIVITLILPLFLDEIIHAIRRSKQKIGVLALTFMISAVIFLIPYTLWVYKLLPYYRLAEIISAGLCIAYCNILTRLRFKWWEFETEADNKPTPSINDKINLLFPAVWLIGAVLILGSMYGLWRMNPDHAFWVSLVLMVVIIIVKIIAGIKKR